MAVVDLAVIAGGTDHLNDKVIGESEFATQTWVHPQETPQSGLGGVSCGLLHHRINIGLGDAPFLGFDQSVDHPDHGITHGLIPTHHSWSQRLLADPVVEDLMRLGITEP